MGVTKQIDDIIANIWRDVLALEHVGPDDHLLDLGGTSLSAMRIAACLSDAFGSEITMDDILREPTPAALARVLGERSGSPGAPGARE